MPAGCTKPPSLPRASGLTLNSRLELVFCRPIDKASEYTYMINNSERLGELPHDASNRSHVIEALTASPDNKTNVSSVAENTMRERLSLYSFTFSAKCQNL